MLELYRWADLQQYMPAVSQTLAEDAAWLSDGELTRQSLTRYVGL